ncbi:MAG TPA: flagellar biosynthesis protein FlgN [Fervidobacterium sp.]|nr:flagellar biosynthesis protein FlgN [Fervidobacterium sp.]HOK87485.1 flagellar biosynthesis protein FlgN [Fervidobacterium sp.]HOM73889.1 flagellar biosynthesis protein FlgN [Fervidobacterium sp.]HOQ39172.1 flagellar biosynthesis protein FlgN [Fervidobacterium sp.]HPP17620.1 flagellar biosynthesis protein FlgN [Fervidobacterium sp.]
MLKDNFERQIRILDSMIQAFKGLEKAVVGRDIELASKYGLNIEELSLEISSVENERAQILKSMGFDTVKEYIEKSNSLDVTEIAFFSAEVVEKLNELTVIMNGIKQMFQFENQYAEFLNCFVKGIHPSTYFFPQKGQNDNNRSVHSIYDRPLYDQFK